MQKKQLIIGLLCLLSLSINFACDRNDYETVPSYCLTFYDVQSYKLILNDSGNIVIRANPSHKYSYFSKNQQDKITYTTLCKQHNDISYNKKEIVETLMGDAGIHSYSRYPITNIEVTSNKSFDSNHAATSSLKDQITLISVSPEKYIKSGYKSTFNWDDKYTPEIIKNEITTYSLGLQYQKANHPIIKKLDDFIFNNTQLLGCGVDYVGVLIFNQEASTKGVHNITVTITLANGEKYTQTIKKEFK